jgi:magnesium-transporting ATPase (P-type)|tara:strand:+ start:347 stop:922 length:576 start_codon:yes stop_codon:yes gene_type:complete
MGEDVALHFGAADLSWGLVGGFAFMVLVMAILEVFPWADWQFREWRIRRAVAQGRHDRADLLSLDRDDNERPRPLKDILVRFAIVLVGAPALMVFQINFTVELEQLLGKDWGFAAMLLTLAFVAACSWLWGRIRRNAMSPEELAALEEEGEHQRWMRAFFREAAASGGAAIAIGIVIVVLVIVLLIAGLPG